jgi:hypothetical protein
VVAIIKARVQPLLALAAVLTPLAETQAHLQVGLVIVLLLRQAAAAVDGALQVVLVDMLQVMVKLPAVAVAVAVKQLT